MPSNLASLGTDCGLESFAPRLEEALASGRRVFLRIMFHSRTVTSPEQIDQLERAVRLAAETPGCEALTLAEVVRRYPDEVRTLNEAGRNVVSQDEVPGTVRSRSVVYQRCVRAAGRPKALLEVFGSARDAYARGDYEAAAGLTEPLNQACGRLLGWGRTAVVVGGALLGLALAWAVTVTGTGKAQAYAVALLGAALGGVCAWWQGTSPDTRRELRLLAASLLIAGTLGAGLGEWAGLGRHSGAAGVARGSAAEPLTTR